MIAARTVPLNINVSGFINGNAMVNISNRLTFVFLMSESSYFISLLFLKLPFKYKDESSAKCKKKKSHGVFFNLLVTYQFNTILLLLLFFFFVFNNFYNNFSTFHINVPLLLSLFSVLDFDLVVSILLLATQTSSFSSEINKKILLSQLILFSHA